MKEFKSVRLPDPVADDEAANRGFVLGAIAAGIAAAPAPIQAFLDLSSPAVGSYLSPYLVFHRIGINPGTEVISYAPNHGAFAAGFAGTGRGESTGAGYYLFLGTESNFYQSAWLEGVVTDHAVYNGTPGAAQATLQLDTPRTLSACRMWPGTQGAGGNHNPAEWKFYGSATGGNSPSDWTEIDHKVGVSGWENTTGSYDFAFDAPASYLYYRWIPLASQSGAGVYMTTIQLYEAVSHNTLEGQILGYTLYQAHAAGARQNRFQDTFIQGSVGAYILRTMRTGVGTYTELMKYTETGLFKVGAGVINNTSPRHVFEVGVDAPGGFYGTDEVVANVEIDLLTVGDTTLYTPPAGQGGFLFTKMLLRFKSRTGTVTSGATFSLGTENPTYANVLRTNNSDPGTETTPWVADQVRQYTTGQDLTDAIQNSKAVRVPASTALKFHVAAAATGVGLTDYKVQVYLFGCRLP